MKTFNKLAIVGCMVLCGVLPGVVRADEEAKVPPDSRWMAAGEEFALADQQKDEPQGGAPAEGGEWQKPIPVSFSLDYTIVSDYIWRGQNFSENTREGAERLNHQLSAGVEVDLKQFGAVGYSVWFEWWGGEQDFNGSDGHLQEVDHTVYWSYDLSNICPVLPVSVELGWIAYVFPQTLSAADGHFTHEVYMILSLDDSKLFGTESGVLNPYFSWNWDLDDFNGHWWEFGISHDFALADLGAGSVPVVKDITVSPSFVMGIDHNFYSPVTFGSGKATRIATLVYGLSVSLDASSALGLPEQYGSLSVSGFLNFSQAIAGVLRDNLMNDEFYGGMSVGWEW